MFDEGLETHLLNGWMNDWMNEWIYKYTAIIMNSGYIPLE